MLAQSENRETLLGRMETLDLGVGSRLRPHQRRMRRRPSLFCSSDAEAPRERGEEEDPAAAVLAVHWTSRVKLWRRPGQEGAVSDPTAAAAWVPPESPLV